MAKTILNKAIERLVLNAMGPIGRSIGNKLLDAAGEISEKKKKPRKVVKDEIEDPIDAPKPEAKPPARGE